MLITTQAIVISAIKYSEADLIVKCFTKSSGLKSYLLRNILKSKKGKLRTAMFQPLMQLEIEANHKDKGTLETIREAKVAYQYRNLHTDITKTALVFFIADMLRSTIIEEEENSFLFDYLTTAIIWLDTHDTIANFHLFFLLKLTQYLGFYPDETHIEFEYFNLIEGTFEPSEINIYCQNGKQIKILKELLGIKFDTLPEIKLNQKQRSDFLTMLLQYYELHLHGFKKPRSLAVLNSIFT
ncbi:DNA repair protein RecO [Dokdonia pacifica]|uniref:DNA repair protein RecO n=1 Tax=Dokdonia pacifica TaxID=1627892 RepID=A0A238WJ52_9FLAO|nr:DNA repair protein RecO [Dokdonia pacifica]GGG21447.1 DNA repair protein RecO [Dokdonia pacifica]SNR46351.1 DNA replication and repair protein RecO [Dokdonia pacifica]